MKYRRVHLDFHTSGEIQNIGKNFSKEQFQKALQLGHVDCITLFAKCHHGWSYHPTAVGETHPHLSFDLLGKQIEAAHEIGVETPVYISGGFDEKLARKKSQWLVRNRDESTIWATDFSVPGYHKFCMNTPYLDYLAKQVREVCEKYDVDGIFMDIVGVQPCYCHYCTEILENRGLDPYDEKNVLKLAEETYFNYTRRIRESIDEVKPGLQLFHNGGHIFCGRRDMARVNTHLEIESLPTDAWGYDYFPMSAAYAKTIGMEYVSMTGKFHAGWGEFGGFKHPNAFLYETALAEVYGASCSIGDQMHPSGEMDLATYKLIGNAYGKLEKDEKYLKGRKNVADVAVLSLEAVCNRCDVAGQPKNSCDIGAYRILFEGNYLFDYIDCGEDFEKYKVIILPDKVLLNEETSEKLKHFVKGGGKILASGHSAVDKNGKFVLNFGAEFVGENEYSPAYFRPGFKTEEYENAAFVQYSQWYKVKNISGEVVGIRENPYFNRTAKHFCSHLHAPNNIHDTGEAMICGESGIYIAWNVFEEYRTCGCFMAKKTVQYALDLLLGNNKSIETKTPSQSIVTLAKGEDDYICHVLYAPLVKRGHTQVIEDIVPLYDVPVRIKVGNVKKIELVPEGKELSFTQKGEYAEFVIPVVRNHSMVRIACK